MYTLEGTEIQFTCGTALHPFHHVEGMEFVKDGIPSYQPIVHHSRLYSTARFVAKQKDTGKYQCKGIFGAASRYSLPFYLIIGSKSDIINQYHNYLSKKRKILCPDCFHLRSFLPDNQWNLFYNSCG